MSSFDHTYISHFDNCISVDGGTTVWVACAAESVYFLLAWELFPVLSSLDYYELVNNCVLAFPLYCVFFLEFSFLFLFGFFVVG